MFNVKVAVLDTDFYALQAIAGYLALDRRTRVIHTSETQQDLFDFLDNAAEAALPGVILFDADHVGTTADLEALIIRLRTCAPRAVVICLAQAIDLALLRVAQRAGARGYFLKRDLRLQIGWAIIFALEHEFVVTHTVYTAMERAGDVYLSRTTALPAPRAYPELTDRIRQAIRLCVIEGMPAHLAADEMGISPHTVRSYIKEAYRILESRDDLEFPVDMTAQERAFYRLTAPEGWRGNHLF